MSSTQSNDSLRELNAKLLAEIDELRKKFAEIKVENDELKDKIAGIPDLRRKFTELEAEKAELKARIAELLRRAVEESKKRDVENAGRTESRSWRKQGRFFS
jgi:predicted nuclease with TOPRIM domain